MKLVVESLNELLNFEKKSDSLDSLGIGKKSLITKWLDEMNIFNYKINKDFTINVKDDTSLNIHNLVELPDYIQFNEIYGSLYCVDSKLRSLKGFPKFVGYNFDCDRNELITLEGCPSSVLGSFTCNKNKLISLKGCPELLEEHFMCEDNQLTTLEGCPKIVKGDFACRGNKVKFTEEDVMKVCNVEGDIYV
jgi:hypothetical protein